MSIQILHYEFLGPIKLDEWGPPMEKVVYLIFSRKKDSFNILYVGDCEKTSEKNFFVNNSNLKCWVKSAGSENLLYLAILPMFDSNQSARKLIIDKILQKYNPPCNVNNIAEQKQDYVIRSQPNLGSKNKSENVEKVNDKMVCACCGSNMEVNKILKNTTILKCVSCGLTDTRLNS